MITFTYIDRHVCHIDPISITGLVLAGLGGGAAAAGASALFGGKGAEGAAPTAPVAPAAAAPPVQNPQGSKAQARSNTPTFIGASAVPEQQGFGQKTLLGQ